MHQWWPWENAVRPPPAPGSTSTGSPISLSASPFPTSPPSDLLSVSMSALVSVPSWLPSMRLTCFGNALTSSANGPLRPRSTGFASMISCIVGGRCQGGYVQTSKTSPRSTTSRTCGLRAIHFSAAVRYASCTYGWYQQVGASLPAALLPMWMSLRTTARFGLTITMASGGRRRPQWFEPSEAYSPAPVSSSR